ncbi:hypothetical protein C8J57DRAFT_1504645 [Mycena rebaudengoi]|nr:hypothetical protein C8J57DRAFT_1504645 [Mycena rebaudengoi]
MCTHLTIETGHSELLYIAANELRVGTPTILERLSMVVSREYPSYHNFLFIPFAQLSIVGGCSDQYSPTSHQRPPAISIVQLLEQYSMDWRDLIRLSRSSDDLCDLLLSGIRFGHSPSGTMIAAPAVHLRTFHVAFTAICLTSATW